MWNLVQSEKGDTIVAIVEDSFVQSKQDIS
jgi:hypothetical protein